MTSRTASGRARRSAALAALALLLPAAPAGAHGTASFIAGQTAEHEKLTRIGVECAPGYQPQDEPGRCLEKQTTDQLAGKFGRFGGVGAADIDSFFEDVPHCTDADWLRAKYNGNRPYPRTRKQALAAFGRCRAAMTEHFRLATGQALDLLTADGSIRPESVAFNCGFIDIAKATRDLRKFLDDWENAGLFRRLIGYALRDVRKELEARIDAAVKFYRAAGGDSNGISGSAKCRILGHLGRILHGMQDFYSHSNWVDKADRDKPLSIHNPPGLDLGAPSPLLDMLGAPFRVPRDFTTSCFALPYTHQNCDDRIDHDDDMGKDKGKITIEPEPDPLPNGFKTDDEKGRRGSIEANFHFAVNGAVVQTAHMWKQFGERLEAVYGTRRAAQMICAIAHDDPLTACPQAPFAVTPVEVPGPAGGTGSTGCSGTFTGNVQTVTEPEDPDHPLDYRWVTTPSAACDLADARYRSLQVVSPSGHVWVQQLGVFGFPGFDGFGTPPPDPVPQSPCRCTFSPSLVKEDGAWVIHVGVSGFYRSRLPFDGSEPPPRGQDDVIVRMFWRAGL